MSRVHRRLFTREEDHIIIHSRMIPVWTKKSKKDFLPPFFLFGLLFSTLFFVISFFFLLPCFLLYPLCICRISPRPYPLLKVSIFEAGVVTSIQDHRRTPAGLSTHTYTHPHQPVPRTNHFLSINHSHGEIQDQEPINAVLLFIRIRLDPLRGAPRTLLLPGPG